MSNKFDSIEVDDYVIFHPNAKDSKRAIWKVKKIVKNMYVIVLTYGSYETYPRFTRFADDSKPFAVVPKRYLKKVHVTENADGSISAMTLRKVVSTSYVAETFDI